MSEVAVSADRGLEVIRTYDDALAPDLLMLYFVDTVTSARRNEIVEENSLEVIHWGGTDIRVLVPTGTHPQLLGEELVARYPHEIEQYDLAFIACGG